MDWFIVKIDKKKLQNGNTPLQTYYCSVFQLKYFKQIQNICLSAQKGG